MDNTNSSTAVSTPKPRRFASLFPVARNLPSYAPSLWREREQRAAERMSRRVRCG